MVNYKEILRLLNEGYSQREIERSLHTSRRKILEFLDEAAHHNITWPLEESVTNEAIEAILFPERYSAGSLPQVRYAPPALRAAMAVENSRREVCTVVEHPSVTAGANRRFDGCKTPCTEGTRSGICTSASASG